MGCLGVRAMHPALRPSMCRQTVSHAVPASSPRVHRRQAVNVFARRPSIIGRTPTSLPAAPCGATIILTRCRRQSLPRIWWMSQPPPFTTRRPSSGTTHHQPRRRSTHEGHPWHPLYALATLRDPTSPFDEYSTQILRNTHKCVAH